MSDPEHSGEWTPLPATIERDGVTLEEGKDFWYAMEPADYSGLVQQFYVVPAGIAPVPEGYAPVAGLGWHEAFQAGLYTKMLNMFPAFERHPPKGKRTPTPRKKQRRAR